MSTDTTNPAGIPALTRTGRWLVLVVGFLGWLFAGGHMAITQQAGRAAAIGLLNQVGQLDADRYEVLRGQVKAAGGSPTVLSESDRVQFQLWKELEATWYAYFQCAFLFGAATGGLAFGWLGDRIGRAGAMTASILTYSALAGAAYFAASPLQLVMIWFGACLGVGGMWPNGVALVSEAWATMSRPMVAGVIGTAANVGIYLFSRLAEQHPITPETWRWVMLVGAAPLVLGLFSWLLVPESPRWLAARASDETGQRPTQPSMGDVFRPPTLGITLVGILLATIPVFGGWGAANWMVPWAESVGTAQLRAEVGQARAITGIVGSLLGGWIASIVGRRTTYFLASLAALAIAQYTFWFVLPTDPWFLFCVSALGLFSGIYFGWLPLCLPELFPTRTRSTGAGVSFNFGRILTAVTVFATAMLMSYFKGDYAAIGRITSLVFGLGMLVIWLAPDTSRKQLAD